MSTDILTNNSVSGLLTSRQMPAAETIKSGKELPPEKQQTQEVTTEELQQVVSQLNDHVQMIQRDLHFSVDDASGKTVIRVVNSETDELVRQIPSEEVLQISRSLKEQVENITGLIVQTSV